jgi:hypothetical protein
MSLKDDVEFLVSLNAVGSAEVTYPTYSVIPNDVYFPPFRQPYSRWSVHFTPTRAILPSRSTERLVELLSP